MDDSEINKIIADFMGWEIIHEGNALSIDGGWSHLPCHSLDVLVPVWEKLKKQIKIKFYMGIHTVTVGNLLVKYNSMEIQQAAAHATAKAILELKEIDNE